VGGVDGVRVFVLLGFLLDGDGEVAVDEDVKVAALLALSHHRLAGAVLELVHALVQARAVVGVEGPEQRDAVARARDDADVHRRAREGRAAVARQATLRAAKRGGPARARAP
jgi:hypothetical protein